MSVYVCFGGIVSKVRSEWNLISKSLLKSPEAHLADRLTSPDAPLTSGQCSPSSETDRSSIG